VPVGRLARREGCRSVHHRHERRRRHRADEALDGDQTLAARIDAQSEPFERICPEELAAGHDVRERGRLAAVDADLQRDHRHHVPSAACEFDRFCSCLAETEPLRERRRNDAVRGPGIDEHVEPLTPRGAFELDRHREQSHVSVTSDGKARSGLLVR
jgi:hypothetical protein